jgi:hypothetical protein
MRVRVRVHAHFEIKDIGQNSPWPGCDGHENIITVTLQPNVKIDVGSVITLQNFNGPADVVLVNRSISAFRFMPQFCVPWWCTTVNDFSPPWLNAFWVSLRALNPGRVFEKRLVGFWIVVQTYGHSYFFF